VATFCLIHGNWHDGSSWTPVAALAARLRPAASPNGDYPLTTHPSVPTVLIYTTDDEFFTPAWERYAATHILGIEPIELLGGHFPMQEHPDTLCSTLERVAADLP
jgi:pimeloyl-ACP methyl ester carboxylesterase